MSKQTTTDVNDLLDKQDATGIAEYVRSGKLSPEDLMIATIERIEQRNPALNALVATRFEQALAEAKAVNRKAPFAGVPFVTKNLGVQVSGSVLSHGSKLFADYVPQTDSELVSRYKRAGFIVVGVSNSPEFGKQATTEPLLYGPTRNPYNRDRSAGGSSGGTAAAVAAGMVPIGHGNDGGGSIRIPASACGLLGLKPSRGRVTVRPDATLFSYPMRADHVLARSVRDCARALDATAGPVPGDAFAIPGPTSPWADMLDRKPQPLRIGVASTRLDGSDLHPDCLAAVENAAALLETLGHQVSEGMPDVDPGEAMAVSSAVMTTNVQSLVDRRLETLGRSLRDDDLEPFTRFLYDMATQVTGRDLVRALEYIERTAWQVGAYFEDVDLWLSPTVPIPMPPIGHLDAFDAESVAVNAGVPAQLTSIFNLTGQPAVSVPLAHDRDGVPVGVQLVAAFGREDLLLNVAAQLERAAPWPIVPAW